MKIAILGSGGREHALMQYLNQKKLKFIVYQAMLVLKILQKISL